MPPALRGSCDTRDFSPDLQGLPPGSAVFGGGDVIAAERKEVVDLIMGSGKDSRQILTQGSR
jgi:hypothetical protein